ncbi:MAG: hypothetical protein KGJ79_06005 [Alphaproteobacteria bacterium]|nr:hypothetical protein [Alphaproteobacteria bacterium]MDE2110675.1 hypothetical protein [Alphaproteobacteria bacterium]MDE2494480.1 hypothetical protein [Alphaproteobacteria bacterium]
MLHQLLIVMFAMTAGFTASGITANLYRLVADKPRTGAGKTAYIAVMVIAGPSVLFENAAKKVRQKSCSKVAFGLAAAVAGYWSFAIGLFVLNLTLAL